MSSATSTYQGWHNYETWAVALWMDNDEGSYLFWRESAQEILREAADRERAGFDLADRLKEEFADSHPLGGQPSVWCDLLNAALSEVDWLEIANHLLEVNENEEG